MFVKFADEGEGIFDAEYECEGGRTVKLGLLLWPGQEGSR